MNELTDNQYCHIPAWAITKLGLKGNDLIVFSIIHGFSQNGENEFTGSLDYLAQWCNSTARSVKRNVDNLLESGYIIKKENYINGVKFCSYVADVNTIHKMCYGEHNMCNEMHKMSENLHKMSSNNIVDNIVDNNIDYNIDNKKENIKEKSLDPIYQEIMDYYNQTCDRRLTLQNKNTVACIKARLKEGYTLDDFKAVIYTKNQEWSKDKTMCKYLVPQTLFGNKFVNYLEQASQPQVKAKSGLDLIMEMMANESN